jgi:hypothetical protein
MNGSATKPSFRFLLCLLAAATLAGCTAQSLSTLDNEWRQGWAAKLEADRKSGPDELAGVAGDHQVKFADLADRAVQAGDDTKDPAVRIGLYRVAALAAWKSGAKRENLVPTLVAKGNSACAGPPSMAAAQPRDCMLFPAIEILAAYDRDLREYKSIDRAIAASADRRPTAAQSKQLMNSFDRFEKHFARVRAYRDSAKQADMPPTYVPWVDYNLKQIYCSSEDAVEFATFDATAEAKQEVRKRYAAMQEKLKADDVPPNCASF